MLSTLASKVFVQVFSSKKCYVLPMELDLANSKPEWLRVKHCTDYPEFVNSMPLEATFFPLLIIMESL